jgi:hypothetical protein
MYGHDRCSIEMNGNTVEVVVNTFPNLVSLIVDNAEYT